MLGNAEKKGRKGRVSSIIGDIKWKNKTKLR
jgi:hypothetical protein